jgi:transcriptional pleiotropic regulator of transition state genes
MKSIGVVRRLDRLGRIVLPAEVRKTFGLTEDSHLEIWIDLERGLIFLQSYMQGCIFCGSRNELVRISGKAVCRECIIEAKSEG